MYKKLTAITMAFVLAFSLLPVGASASDDGKYSPAVKLMTDLNIMDIDEYSDNFWDDTPVKRRELAQILCNIFSLEPKKEETPLFDDVSEDYRGCVETVARFNYMSGYGDGKFGPNDYVTGEQVVKIFVSIICGDALAEELGGYPIGYYLAARRIGMISPNITVSGDAARRIDVANIIYSALESDAISVSSVNSRHTTYKHIEGETFLSKYLDIYRYEGILCKNKVTSLTDGSAVPRGVQIGETVVDDTDDLAGDYLGYKVVAYVKKADDDDTGNIVSISAAKKNDTLEIDADDFHSVNGFEFKYYDENKEKNVQMSPGCKMVYNGVSVKYDVKRFEFDIGKIKLIDNDYDGIYDVISITDYKTVIVGKVNVKDEKIFSRYDNTVLELSNNYCKINNNGEKADLSIIKDGNVILAAVSENTIGKKAIKIELSSKKVSGSVDLIEKSDEATYVEVYGERYKISKYAENLADKGIIPHLENGERVQMFIDAFGNAAYYKMNSSGTSVGYLAEGIVNTEKMTPCVNVKIYTENEEFVYLTAENKVKINGQNRNISGIDASLKNRFTKTGLVEYESENGVLKSINFPASGYSVDEFSLDDSYDRTGTLFNCSSSTMLENKYTVSNITPVFVVPVDDTDDEAAHYMVSTGSYFRPTYKYQAYLYDIADNGNVKYCMVRSEPSTTSKIDETDALLIVKNVRASVDDDGNNVNLISGVNESDQETTLLVKDDTLMQVTVQAGGSNIKRTIDKGDIIQYNQHKDGTVSLISLVHNNDAGSSYYKPCAVDKSKRGVTYYVTQVYGCVARTDSSNIVIKCGDVSENVSVLEADSVIPLNGGLVYSYDSERGKLIPISASDIERGDNLFACTNQVNKLRMLVVYN